ncbi:MAG: hypothetical protein ABII88_06150 [Candidatus Omnitrophota bacterium]
MPEKKKKQYVVRKAWLIVSIYVVCSFLSIVYAKEQTDDTLEAGKYKSISWENAVNEPEKENSEYPEKRKITPATVRLTVNEYYVPQISELINKGVDCLEWLNNLDDPYLNRYKLDLRVDPADERFKLFWREKF